MASESGVPNIQAVNQPSSIVLTPEEATQLLQAAHAEEARCQGLKSRSEKQLEDAITQLEQAEKQLFDAQLSLGHLHYILKRSNFQFAAPGMQDRVRHIVEVNNYTRSITLPDERKLAIVLD